MTADEQLALVEPETLTFVACCGFCDQAIAAVPVEPIDNWREAEAWCYLATKRHQQQCEAWIREQRRKEKR